MEPLLEQSVVRRVVEKYRRLAERRQQRTVPRLKPDSDLAKEYSRPRALTAAATRASISELATVDPAPVPKPCCAHRQNVHASSCCRSDSRSGRCLASISRDVRKTRCQVAAQGDRVVADLDLLRTQLLARLTSIQTSLHALAGTPITAREILAAPGGTFVISKPGHYTIAGDVTITGTTHTTPVIDIRANDVVLDLGSFVMNQPDATLTTGRVAIQISGPAGNGASNVTVQNGTIRGFLGLAVEFLGQLHFAALNVLSGSDLITLQNLRFVATGADASFTTDAVDASVVIALFVSNVIVRQSFFDGVRGDGLRFESVQGLLVEDVLMTNFLPKVLTTPGGLVQQIVGINMFEDFADTSVSNDITIRRTIFEDFHIAVPAGTTVSNANISGVTIQNPRVPVAPTVGIVGHNILFEDVLARRFSATGAHACIITGINVTGSTDPTFATPEIRSDPIGAVFRRVVAHDLSAAAPVMPVAVHIDSSAFGITAFCQQSLVEDCVVQNLVYTGEPNPSPNATSSLIGVLFRSGQGCVVRRCSAMGLDNTRFGPNPNPDTTAFETCICGVVGALIEENYAGDNAADPSSGTAAGFSIISTIDTVLRNNVAADNNYAGFVAFDLSVVKSKNNLYQSNTVTGSAFAGFFDFNTDSNSAYIDNFARSALFNYLSNAGGPNVLFGAQIVQWAIPAPAPTANITKLTNLSVSP